ncbi:MAG TPA: methionyl-tRNA formyltransferase, partial [Spirochaetia bacterium]|nr:methionyl-tRNA formyltransferase [Spirochaetia bacterium]
LSGLGADLVSRVAAEIAAGRAPQAVPQEESRASYCRLVRKEDGIIDWTEPAALIEGKVRAYDPWPRASTTLRGASLLLLKTSVHPDTLVSARVPGDIVAADGENGILVQTGQGILKVERLQLQFKKPTDWRSFLNGHPDLRGLHLGTIAGVI